MENYVNILLGTRLIQIIIIELSYMNMYYIEMEMVNGISLPSNNHQVTHFMDDIDGMEVKIYYQDILIYTYLILTIQLRNKWVDLNCYEMMVLGIVNIRIIMME